MARGKKTKTTVKKKNQNQSEGKKTSPPVFGITPQRIKVHPVWGENLIKNLGSEKLACCTAENDERAVDKGFFTDEYYDNSTQQGVKREDNFEEVMNASACYTKSTYGEAVKKTYRNLWVMPETIQSGTTISVDPRGQVIDVNKAEITFKNAADFPIEVNINTPVAAVGVPGFILTRLGNTKFKLGPRKQRTFLYKNVGSNWITMPLVGVVKDAEQKGYRAAALADYCVIIPDINPNSGKEMTEQQGLEIVRITTKVKYTSVVNSSFAAGPVNVEKKRPFARQNIGGVESMYSVNARKMPVEVKKKLGMFPEALAAPQHVAFDSSNTMHYITMNYFNTGHGDETGLKLVNCDSEGRNGVNLKLKNYEKSHYILNISSFGYVRSQDGSNNHGSLMGDFAYDKDRAAWILVQGGKMFTTSLDGRKNNNAITLLEKGCYITDTDQYIVDRIGQFKDYGVDGWVEVAEFLDGVITIVGIVKNIMLILSAL